MSLPPPNTGFPITCLKPWTLPTGFSTQVLTAPTCCPWWTQCLCFLTMHCSIAGLFNTQSLVPCPSLPTSALPPCVISQRHPSASPLLSPSQSLSQTPVAHPAWFYASLSLSMLVLILHLASRRWCSWLGRRDGLPACSSWASNAQLGPAVTGAALLCPLAKVQQSYEQLQMGAFNAKWQMSLIQHHYLLCQW